MGFLRRLFGSDKKAGSQADAQGLYFFIECDNCGARVRVRADKQYDLNRTDDGFVWHKTIVDSRCFRQIPTVVQLDRSYNVVSTEIDGGHYITREEYEAPEAPLASEPPDDTTPQSAQDPDAD